MTERVLLVEDDTSIATVITAALEDDGYTVHRCDSIERRDEFLAANDYAVMLTDVMLADGDGITALDQMRAAFPGGAVTMTIDENLARFSRSAAPCGLRCARHLVRRLSSLCDNVLGQLLRHPVLRLPLHLGPGAGRSRDHSGRGPVRPGCPAP